MEYIFLILGFALLFTGGDLLVKAGVSLATHFRISTLAIGVTVVSFGTSAPELIVSISATLKGHPDIALGNIIGSNISNIAMVLGVMAVILPLPVERNLIRIDWPFMMLASLIFYLFTLNGTISYIEGIILTGMLAVYLYMSVHNSRTQVIKAGYRFPKARYGLIKSLFIFILASAGLYFGADFLVDSAGKIALNLGVSERVIAVTIIAFGTSVPELATSVAAVVKKETGITTGNIIGSNIFNILAVPGITSIIKTVSVSREILPDIYSMLGISVALLLLMVFGNKVLTRNRGVLLLLLYGLYIAMVLSV